jgi:hypothetical protein
MKLHRIIASCLLSFALFGIPVVAQHSRSSAAHTATTSRPYYGGGHHTESHGGSYGVSGSSHRGGHYRSTTGSHHYGRHK